MKGGALFMAYVQELAGFIAENKDVAELADAMKSLEIAQGALGEVAFWLSSTGGKDRALALLQATPFLELFGDIAVGQLLIEQGVIALDALEQRVGTRTPTAEQIEADEEAKFYYGKVVGARFFAAEVLSQAKAKARAMTCGERAALDVIF